MSLAFFCTKCGLRLDAPGACAPACPLPELAPEVEVEEGEQKASMADRGKGPVEERLERMSSETVTPPPGAVVPAEAVTATELPEAKSEPAPEPKAPPGAKTKK